MSASIFTTIYVAGFRPEALSFLLFIAVGPAVLGLLALPFLDAQTGSETVTEDGNCKGVFPGLGQSLQRGFSWCLHQGMRRGRHTMALSRLGGQVM